MASGIYNRFKANLMNAEIDLEHVYTENDGIKVMLLDDNHSFNAAHNTKSQIEANEISGTGYTAGGVNLDNKTVTQGATTKFDADDASWPIATFSAWHAVIYDEENGNLICSIDLGGEKAVLLGELYIEWDSDGIITLT